MPPQLALLLTIFFIVYLFRQDSREQNNASPAHWVPCIWMMLLGSRPVSSWLNLTSPYQSADDLMEGSPVDRVVFLLLIVVGLVVLWRRQVSWSQVFRDNAWLTLFFVYCALSILWSDFPFIAFKRWIKGLGDPMMALILLTDREPMVAVASVIKRCAYVLVPLSILFIKYYPSLGRGYDDWTGEAYYAGVTTGKNLLGLLCLVFGLFFVCRLCLQWEAHHKLGPKTGIPVTVLLLLMIQWLLWTADSKTSLMSLILGILVVMALGFRSVRKHVGTYIIAGILAYAVLELAFDVTGSVTSTVGRDPTLTGRTELWKVVLSMSVNPLLGAGFESFWLGERLKTLWAQYYFKPNQAHNGYIEIYLNLGCLGLVLVGGVIVAHYKKIRRALMLSVIQRRTERTEFDFAKFRMAFLISYLIYNITEGAFKGLSFLFVIFLIIAIEYRQVETLRTELDLSTLSEDPDNASRVMEPMVGRP